MSVRFGFALLAAAVAGGGCANTSLKSTLAETIAANSAPKPVELRPAADQPAVSGKPVISSTVLAAIAVERVTGRPIEPADL